MQLIAPFAVLFALLTLSLSAQAFVIRVDPARASSNNGHMVATLREAVEAIRARAS
jgi:hypothetical protein